MPFNSDINKDIMNIPIYESQINELKKELNEEKERNKKLVKENDEEKNKNNILIKENNELKEKNKKLIDENNELKEKLKNINQKNNESLITSEKKKENKLVINFVIQGFEYNNLKQSYECNNTDLFVKLEEKLYEDFPIFKRHETYFEVNSKRVMRFESLEENNIKDKDEIILFVLDDKSKNDK